MLKGVHGVFSLLIRSLGYENVEKIANKSVSSNWDCTADVICDFIEI